MTRGDRMSRVLLAPLVVLLTLTMVECVLVEDEGRGGQGGQVGRERREERGGHGNGRGRRRTRFGPT